MTRVVRVRPEAEADLLETAAWYDGREAGLGIEFVAAIDQAIAKIAAAPFAFPQWTTELPHRRYPVRRFPFVVFYVVDEATVDVVAIAHGKRRPGFWQRR